MSDPMEAVVRAPRIDGPVRRLSAGGQPGAEAAAPRKEETQPAPAAALPASAPAMVPPELVRAAEKRGYDAGFESGAKAGRAEFLNRLERLDQLLESIAAKRDDLLEVLEDDLVELAFEAIGSILGTAEARKDLIVESVRRLLAVKIDTQVLKVKVSPDDLALVSEGMEPKGVGLGSRIELEADPEIRLGGCVVETARGSLDARLDLVLDKLRQALLDGRDRGESVVAP